MENIIRFYYARNESPAFKGDLLCTHTFISGFNTVLWQQCECSQPLMWKMCFIFLRTLDKQCAETLLVDILPCEKAPPISDDFSLNSRNSPE